MGRQLVLIDALVAYGIFRTGPLLGDEGGLFSTCLQVVLLSFVGVHGAALFLSDREAAWRKLCSRMGRVAGYGIGAGLTLHDFQLILSDTNSTAGLGLIILPFLFGTAAAFFYYVGWGLGFAWAFRREERKELRFAAWSLVGLCGLALIAGAVEGVDMLRQQSLITRVALMQDRELHTVLQDPWASKKRWVLNAIACNQNLSQEDLLFMAGLADPKLHEKGRPQVLSDACNHKGLAVMRLVALHANVGADALELLSHSKNSYVLQSVIGNPKTPDEVVERLRGSSDEDSVIKMAFADRARRQKDEHPAEDVGQPESPAAVAPLIPVNPDADVVDKASTRSETDAVTPRQTGCSMGRRAALFDFKKFPKIAACSAHWLQASMRAKKTGLRCGGRVSCEVPADACASGWHLCGAGPKGASELRLGLSAEQCAGLAEGRFVAALSDTDCGSCGTGGGQGAVCCGRGCVQQHGNCVWPRATAWAGMINDHINSCGDIEMSSDDNKNGVLCCLDTDSSPVKPVEFKKGRAKKAHLR